MAVLGGFLGVWIRAVWEGGKYEKEEEQVEWTGVMSSSTPGGVPPSGRSNTERPRPSYSRAVAVQACTFMLLLWRSTAVQPCTLQWEPNHSATSIWDGVFNPGIPQNRDWEQSRRRRQKDALLHLLHRVAYFYSVDTSLRILMRMIERMVDFISTVSVTSSLLLLWVCDPCQAVGL